MKKHTAVLLAAVFAAALATEASAQDGSAYDWSGFYVGGNVGYGFADSDWVLVNNASGHSTGDIGKTQTSPEFEGMLGGIQIGRNWQDDKIVYGLEAALTIPDLEGYGTWTNSSGYFRDASSDINWIASLTGRGGMTFDKTLVYGKAGLAFAGVDYTHTGGQPGQVRHFEGSETTLGVIVGAGVEQALTDKWSLKFDYSFTYLGINNTEVSEGGRTAVFNVDQGIHSLAVGVNYRF
ncbi:outer membrane protein [Ciceribacter selenitireducens]|nr:outer membrane beta-barrel protein [Ciceribacter selenitireducens]